MLSLQDYFIMKGNQMSHGDVNSVCQEPVSHGDVNLDESADTGVTLITKQSKTKVPNKSTVNRSGINDQCHWRTNT